MNIGNVEPLEVPMELPSENVVPARAQSASNVPLEEFLADEIVPSQGLELNLEGVSQHLPAVAVASADRGPIETSPQRPASSEISSTAELPAETQLKLQQFMEKKPQIECTRSNVLKPFDDDQSDLVANLR